MRKRLLSFMALTAIVLGITFIVLPTESASASIADGTYKINYEMKSAGSNSTSIADGFFSKPATLTVNNGVKHIQLTVTSSSMVKSLRGPNGAVDVVSDSGETRTVKFRVDGDLSQPVTMKMLISVPDMKEMPGGYEADQTARAFFNVSGLPAAGATNNKSNSPDNGVAPVVDNPKTGDSTPIALYIMLLLGSGAIGVYAVRKLRVAKN